MIQTIAGWLFYLLVGGSLLSAVIATALERLTRPPKKSTDLAQYRAAGARLTLIATPTTITTATTCTTVIGYWK